MERVPRPGVGGLTGDAAGAPSAAEPRCAVPGRLPAFDAVVLAGGRATRLGGYPKPQLAYRGATLLEHALAAVGRARAVAVVGPGPGEPGGPPRLPRAAAPPSPSRLVFTREEPPFAGPLAALAAGLAALPYATPGHRWVAVVAADVPRAPEALAALLAAACHGPVGDGILGHDEHGRPQPLLSLYRRTALEGVLGALAAEGGLANRPMKHLVARLDLLPLRLPPQSSSDVDTWDAARRWGIQGPDVPGRAPRQEEAHE